MADCDPFALQPCSHRTHDGLYELKHCPRCRGTGFRPTDLADLGEMLRAINGKLDKLIRARRGPDPSMGPP